MTPETLSERDPLTEAELDRLEHGAIWNTSRGHVRECEVCALESPLVVRALVELKALRDAKERGVKMATYPPNDWSAP